MYPTIQVRPIEVRINSVCSVLVITDTENNKKDVLVIQITMQVIRNQTFCTVLFSCAM